MTADPRRVLLYARGGGFGHTMRAAELQRALVSRGLEVTLLVEPASARHLPPLPRGATLSQATALPGGHDTLIVDTFPRGWRGELTVADLARFRRTILISRYNREQGFVREAAAYHRLLNPYPPDLDEWTTPPPRSFYAGWLVRAPQTHLIEGEAFVVFDPGARLSPALTDIFGRLAKRTGRALRILRTWREVVPAAKLLCIGAGYNTVYELAPLPADVRFVPLARRWDDQARRARRAGRCIGSLDELARWLAAPVHPRPTVGGRRYDTASLLPLWSDA